MERETRVVHFFSSASGYRWFLDQVLTLQSAGVEVECIVGTEGWITEQLRNRGIPVYIFDLSLPWSVDDLSCLADRLSRFSGLVRFLILKRYDAAHFHLFESAVVGRLAAWVAGIPNRIRMNETPATLEGGYARRIELALQKLDTRTVASSALIRAQYLAAGVPPDQVPIVYYGASAETFCPAVCARADTRHALAEAYGIPAVGPLVGMVAHFYSELPISDFTASKYWGRPVKLHKLFVDAAEEVLRVRPDAVFVLAGGAFRDVDKAYFARIKQYVVERGLGEKIFFTGMLSNIQDLLGALDLSVQCSTFDNLGGVLESLAMGCPVLATDVGAFREAIIDGETGLLVQPDGVDLGGKILELLRAPAIAAAMGQRGRLLVREKFSAEGSAVKLAQLYRTNARSSQSVFLIAARACCALPQFLWIACLLSRRDIQSRMSAVSMGSCFSWLLRLQKRCADVLLSVLLLLLLSPLAVLVATENLLCRRPLIHFYQICGLNKRPVKIFICWPLESMENGTLSACAGRGFGYVLWWLPLLFSVLVGKMSIVGPCLRPAGFESYDQSWHNCRPGIIGWTQTGAFRASREAEEQDSLYATTCGPWLDLKIVLKSLLRPNRSGVDVRKNQESPASVSVR